MWGQTRCGSNLENVRQGHGSAVLGETLGGGGVCWVK